MGTRSITHIVDDNPIGRMPGDERPLVTIYRQYDGAPTGMGADLKLAVNDRRIVNGYGSDDTSATASNGMGCLAATVIKALKEGIGNTYIVPAGTRDVDEEYTYTLYPLDGAVGIRAVEVGWEGNDKVLYDGPISGFLA